MIVAPRCVLQSHTYSCQRLQIPGRAPRFNYSGCCVSRVVGLRASGGCSQAEGTLYGQVYDASAVPPLLYREVLFREGWPLMRGNLSHRVAEVPKHLSAEAVESVVDILPASVAFMLQACEARMWRRRGWPPPCGGLAVASAILKCSRAS